MDSVTTSPFVLSRATEADIDEITRLEFKCFSPEICEIFLGCTLEADLPKICDVYRSRMRNEHNYIVIKVSCRTTNRIIAASHWKVFPGDAPAPLELDEKPVDWLDGEVLEKAKKIIGEMNIKRRAANPGGYVHLHICLTDKEYRRRGAGAMMLKWGCDLADQLFLPAWIEASPEGNMLYKTFGFREYELIDEPEGMNMIRDPQVTAIEGGRAIAPS